MAGICNSVGEYVLEFLKAKDGDELRLNTVAGAERAGVKVTPHSITLGNSAPDLVERTARGRYPAIQVYCDKLTNSLREKFRTVSGTVHVTIEVRYSQERLEFMETGLQALADAVCTILDDTRGDWGSGNYYAGGYEASFGPVKAGGQGFLQVGKIGFEVQVSR